MCKKKLVFTLNQSTIIYAKKHTNTSTAINNNDLIVIAGFGDQINQLVNSLTDIVCLENIDFLSSKVDNLITTLNNTKTQSTSYAKVTSQAINPYDNIQIKQNQVDEKTIRISASGNNSPAEV